MGNGAATFDTNSNDGKTLMTDVKLQDVLTGRPLRACCFIQTAFQTPHATCTGATMQPHNRSHTGFEQGGGGGIKLLISLLII